MADPFPAVVVMAVVVVVVCLTRNAIAAAPKKSRKPRKYPRGFRAQAAVRQRHYATKSSQGTANKTWNQQCVLLLLGPCRQHDEAPHVGLAQISVAVSTARGVLTWPGNRKQLFLWKSQLLCTYHHLQMYNFTHSPAHCPTGPWRERPGTLISLKRALTDRHYVRRKRPCVSILCNTTVQHTICDTLEYNIT